MGVTTPFKGRRVRFFGRSALAPRATISLSSRNRCAPRGHLPRQVSAQRGYFAPLSATLELRDPRRAGTPPPRPDAPPTAPIRRPSPPRVSPATPKIFPPSRLP